MDSAEERMKKAGELLVKQVEKARKEMGTKIGGEKTGAKSRLRREMDNLLSGFPN